jgi:glutathione S-transferase
MILLGQYDSPVTRRVGIALHHYGMPFTRDTRSVFGDAAAVAKISPLTRIPALILDDGEVLTDSAAILDHLDEAARAASHPAPPLVPPSGPERRHILQATALAQATLEKAGAVIYERHFHPAAHISPEWEARCLGQMTAGLAELERRCAAPYFCGETLTHADVMTTCTIAYLHLRLPEGFPPGHFPKIAALAARCEALPAFRAAAISPDETMPTD